ncbi:MAG: hypothetical protein CXZ00_12675 [Acidobacteria bacterium]|nr:MAG: hypothetical protein CXZ00_12675 [Acidobacteriota bacterium]
MSEFKRGLSDRFIMALTALAQKPGWWQDVLADASLIIGIRDEELDVYWNGQSLFHAVFDGERVNVNTHVKYLLDPERKDRVALKEDGSFQVVPTPMLERYASGSLKKLKTAADLFSGMEKQGVHAIAKANENIIDVEIRLDAKDLDTERDQPRIDIAVFEQSPDGVELMFWEAKLFANKELRASESAPVVRQIEEYKRVLEERQAGVLSSYRRVAKNLVAIAEMSGGVRKVGPAIQAVADGTGLRMSSPANVGLVIFGFDDDQKAVGGYGHKHFEKLKKQLGEKSVRACGKAVGLKLCFQS